MRSIIFMLMLFSFTVPAGIVCAETLYVSDELVITLREGMGSEFKIIKMLKTGAPLEVIEESEPYLKVRTRSGLEGWVLKQYVTEETPKTAIISELEKRIDRLNAKIEQNNEDKKSLQGELKTVRSDHNTKIKDLKQNVSSSRGKTEQTAGELKKITRKYNALVKNSKDVVNIVKERDTLKDSNSTLQTESAKLTKENEELKKMQMIWWFAAGAGVFFVGWIVGKVSRQKKFY